MASALQHKVVFILALLAKSSYCDSTTFEESSISKSERSQPTDSSSSESATDSTQIDEQLLESLEQKLVERVIGSKFIKNEVLPDVSFRFATDAVTDSSADPSTVETTEVTETESESVESERSEKDSNNDEDLSMDSSEEVIKTKAPEAEAVNDREKPQKSLFDHPRLQMTYNQVGRAMDEAALYPSRSRGNQEPPPKEVIPLRISNGFFAPSNFLHREKPLFFDNRDLVSMAGGDRRMQPHSEGVGRHELPMFFHDRRIFPTTTHSHNPSVLTPLPGSLYRSPNGVMMNDDSQYNGENGFRLTPGGYELYNNNDNNQRVAPLSMMGNIPARVESGQAIPNFVSITNGKPFPEYMPRPLHSQLPMYHYPNHLSHGNYGYESNGGPFGYAQPLRSPPQDTSSVFRAFGNDLTKLMQREKEEEKIAKEKDIWEKLAPPYEEAQVESSNKKLGENQSINSTNADGKEGSNQRSPYDDFIGFRTIQNSFRPDSWLVYGNRPPDNAYIRVDPVGNRLQKLRKAYWRPYDQDRYIDSFDETSNELHNYGNPFNMVSGNNNNDAKSLLAKMYASGGGGGEPQYYGNRGTRLSEVEEGTDVPQCAQKDNNTMCFEDPNYPRSQILYALDIEGFMLQRLFAPRDTKNIKPAVDVSDSVEDGRVCDTVVDEGQPLRAINTLGQWKVILNIGDVETYKPFAQRIRTEKCGNPGQACSFTKDDVQTHCVQKYTFEHLIAWSPKKGLHMDVFELPIACTCQIIKSSAVL